MRTYIKILGAGAVAGAVALTGSAFTAGVTTTGVSALAGTGSVTISGATLNSVSFVQDTTGTKIDAANLVLDADMTGNTVTVGFGTTAGQACTVGTYDATKTETPVTCSGLATDITAASTFNVTVTK